MKLYLFKNMNYYIGDNLTDEMEQQGVILTTDVVENKSPKITVDENGINIDWIEVGELDDLQ